MPNLNRTGHVAEVSQVEESYGFFPTEPGTNRPFAEPKLKTGTADDSAPECHSAGIFHRPMAMARPRLRFFERVTPRVRVERVERDLEWLFGGPGRCAAKAV